MEYSINVLRGDFDVICRGYFVLIKDYFRRLFERYGEGRVVVTFFGAGRNVDFLEDSNQKVVRNSGIIMVTRDFSSYDALTYDNLLKIMRNQNSKLGYVHAIHLTSDFNGNRFIVKVNSNLLLNAIKPVDFRKFFDASRLDNHNVDVLLKVNEGVDSGCLIAFGLRDAA